MVAGRLWHIECREKLIKGQPYKEDTNKDTPILYFEEEGKKFTVEFENRSDFMASSFGHIADITVISHSRSNRDKGRIANIKI